MLEADGYLLLEFITMYNKSLLERNFHADVYNRLTNSTCLIFENRQAKQKKTDWRAYRNYRAKLLAFKNWKIWYNKKYGSV